MKRPVVFMNMAMTADGKTTSAALEMPTFTSGADRRRMDELRARADAIVQGAGTVRADNQPLRIRDPDIREQREKAGRTEPPIAVVISASLDLDPDSALFTGAEGRVIVASPEGADADHLGGRAEVWRVGDQRVDLAQLLERLKAEGVEQLLVEGGSEINWQFLHGGLFDELFITLAPAILGGRDAPTIMGGAGFAMDSVKPLELLEVDRVADELFLHYRVKR